LISGDAPVPPATLNIQLKFLCLSVADDRLGALEAHQLSRLSRVPTPTSLKVTTLWYSGTGIAVSHITDRNGNDLLVEESIDTEGQCLRLPHDEFQFAYQNGHYSSNFCITSQRTERYPNLRVAMQVSGAQTTIAALKNRIVAAASCFPVSSADILNDGTKVGRQVVRTSDTESDQR
jgi:hypothetical protein